MGRMMWALPVLASACALAFSANGQELPLLPPPPSVPAPVEKSDDSVVIKSRVELVNVAVTVRDKRDALVPDLTQPDFHVFENGKEQKIVKFSRETDMPLTIALLFDVSGSMGRWFPDEERAGRQFLQRVIRPGDRALVAAFDFQTELFRDLTGDVELLKKSLARFEHPNFGFGGTSLFDSMKLLAVRRLAPQEGRKVMIVLSDWEDTTSKSTLEQALEAAQRSDSVVYAIAYPGTSGVGAKMAKETGGRLFKAAKGVDLDRIFDEIEKEMRSQYLISYTADNIAHDGKYHKIDIKLPFKDFKVQARPGYWAPRSGSARLDPPFGIDQEINAWMRAPYPIAFEPANPVQEGSAHRLDVNVINKHYEIQ